MDSLKLGQAWVCSAVGSAPPLMCIVGKLDFFSEVDEESQIVSLCIVPHPEAKNAGWPKVDHIPIFESAFHTSGLKLAKDNVALGPDFEKGYSKWRMAFDQGKASVFSMPVSKAYEAVASIVLKH
ncbi:MAG: hypothetical protein GY952_19610 [Rhodobacteraceae bacterium]|nr:hypothetical protein [Paracoccaceae bacterium]